jgi:hypothetical protein
MALALATEDAPSPRRGEPLWTVIGKITVVDLRVAARAGLRFELVLVLARPLPVGMVTMPIAYGETCPVPTVTTRPTR